MPVETDPIIARVHKTIPASAARVFEAWTEPEQLVRWAWGADRKAWARVDLRVGGRYVVGLPVEPGSDGWEGDVWAMTGHYVEIVPARRLIYTVRWDAPVVYNQAGEPVLDEIIDVRFEDVANGCTIEHAHIGIPLVEAAREHLRAVDQTLDVLAQLVTGD
ncbi:MAG: SRPBCC family protein [Planctomycetota bacterium]|jgi:uncharacterized protein YndB with AHSA1/START domain